MLELIPITNRIGTEVLGIDLAKPISSDDFDRIYQAWSDTTILLFRNQTLTPKQHIELTNKFGEVVSYTRSNFSENEYPEILVLSNIEKDGKLIGSPVSGRVWHTDGHYLEKPPAGSIMYAIETPPEGGDTLFANMFIAYEELPGIIKAKISDLKVVISRLQSRHYNYPERGAPTELEIKEWIDIPQPMVLLHPENGRKAIYAGGNVPWHVVGMNEEESAPLVTFVQEFSIMEKYTYRHKWRPGDLIVWENRSAMHCATPYDHNNYRRLMHRTTFDIPRPI